MIKYIRFIIQNSFSTFLLLFICWYRLKEDHLRPRPERKECLIIYVSNRIWSGNETDHIPTFGRSGISEKPFLYGPQMNKLKFKWKEMGLFYYLFLTQNNIGVGLTGLLGCVKRYEKVGTGFWACYRYRFLLSEDYQNIVATKNDYTAKKAEEKERKKNDNE